MVSDSCDPWAIAFQALLSMEFSRQEYWSGLPFPLQAILPTQGVNLGFLNCRQTFYHLSHQGSLYKTHSRVPNINMKIRRMVSSQY